VEAPPGGATLVDLRKIVRDLPHLDSSDTTFVADVMAAAGVQPEMPEALSWD
jgi:hypothetical protein